MQTQTLYLGLIMFVVGLLAEIFMFYTKYGWGQKRALEVISIVFTSFSFGIFVLYAFSPAAILIALISFYRTVNSARIVEQRMHEQYLHRAAKRSFLWLAGSQILCIILWIIFYLLPSVFSGRSALVVMTITIAMGGAYVLHSTITKIKSTKVINVENITDKELPTLTLAIAARNENAYLQQCLEAAIASDYPKLEIIVLDDCSQDHTPDIIKSFAHDGVRFVQGEKPNELWLPKNQAYQTLLDQAAGELILYMGVDVILEPESLRAIVEIFINKQVLMMGIMPKRTKSGVVAAFIQPMRYWWELALPKWVIKHEPVLSSCWIANRQALIKKGAFASVMRAITPEEYLSTAFSKQPNGYSFVRASGVLKVTTNKSLISQWYTALRIRYPQAHRRPEYVAIRVLIMLYFFVSPYLLLPLLVITHSSVTALFATTIAVVALSAANVLVAAATNPATALFAAVSFPVVVIIDYIAIHISMYRYEFGEVIWKGRNVTSPVMHVIPHLPSLD